MRVSRTLAVVAIGTFLAAVPAADAALIQLAAGESAVVDGMLRVTFEETTLESRCPIPLACFWEGDAVALVTARVAGNAGSFELHTFRDFGSEANFQEYVIELVQLDPYPREGVVIDPEDYVATLDVRMRPVADEPVSWSALKGRFD